MRNLLKRLRGMGKTIIVSSHILPELADICNKVGIIDRGVMNVSAEVADVMRQVRRQIVLHIRVTNDPEQAKELLESEAIVDQVHCERDLMVVMLHENATSYDELATRLIEHGFGVRLFKEEEISLEAAFMALTKGMRAVAGETTAGETVAEPKM